MNSSASWAKCDVACDDVCGVVWAIALETKRRRTKGTRTLPALDATRVYKSKPQRAQRLQSRSRVFLCVLSGEFPAAILPAMRYRKLGRTGYTVSEIAHGLWGMGGW